MHIRWRALRGAVGLLAWLLAAPASAADAGDDGADLRSWQRLSGGVAALSNHSWGAVDGGGPGAAVSLAYDLFLTPSHGVGVVAGTGIDFGSYGADSDSMSWREAGLRYTYALVLSDGARWRPFASAGLALGRTGGELQSTNWMSTLGADAGVEWLATRHVSLAARASERASRIDHPAGAWWHNSLAATVDLAVRLPL